MIFSTLASAVKIRNLANKKTKSRSSRSKYIIEKYEERSIVNRYFK